MKYWLAISVMFVLALSVQAFQGDCSVRDLDIAHVHFQLDDVIIVPSRLYGMGMRGMKDGHVIYDRCDLFGDRPLAVEKGKPYVRMIFLRCYREMREVMRHCFIIGCSSESDIKVLFHKQDPSLKIISATDTELTISSSGHALKTYTWDTNTQTFVEKEKK